MSQSRTFEGRTIEEALRAAAAEFGPDVEVVDASKERRGGVFGFFAKERFVVTAHGHAARPDAPDEDFGDLLLKMADGISDTYEADPQPSDDSQAAIEARARRAVAAASRRPEPGSIGVIDLREGRRVPKNGSTPDPTPDPGFSFGGSERPSQLRRRLEAASAPQRAPHVASAGPVSSPVGAPPAAAHGSVHVAPAPVAETFDTAPAWSLDGLRALGLPESILATVEKFDPSSDIEWLHAIAIAIGRLLPDTPVEDASVLVGEGRGSAVDLVRGVELGLEPGYLVIDGQQVRATPDELALAIRECLR